jgi:AraC-like DNA-binding protein
MILLDHGGAGRHAAALIPPPPDLAPLVEHFFIQGARDAGAWWVVPDASSHLVAAVVVPTPGPAASRVRLMLVGARSTAARVGTAGRLLTVGARFHPGALPALVRMPANAFTDVALPATDVFARSVVRDSVLDPDGGASAFVAQLTGMIRRAAAGARPSPLTRALDRARSVTAAAANASIGSRALYQFALEHVGLSPKRALRVQRLHRALIELSAAGAKGTGRAVTLSAAAHAAGFADHAHFTRECRALLGMTPTAWLALGADSFKAGRARLG